MALAQEDVEQIQILIKKILSESPEAINANVRYELDLRERTIRVEEELKHQRELMLEGFKQADKRFEQVDKRFEQMAEQMNKRFEQVDRRLEQMAEQMNKRFEQVDKRIDQIDKRFEEMGRRLDRFMFWSLGITVSCAVFVVNYLK
ncbi:MAG: hypothetical protein NTY50_21855 [Methylobacter sp.]|nr:hypothetical protein [Methylobacter sp.]